MAAAAFVGSLVFRSALIAASGVLNADRFKTGSLTWLVVTVVCAATSTLVLYRYTHTRGQDPLPAVSPLSSATEVLRGAARSTPSREIELAVGQVQQMRAQRDTLATILAASTAPDAWPDLHRLFDALEAAVAVNCKKLATYATSGDRHSMGDLLSRNTTLLEQAAEANRKVTTLVAEEQGSGDTDRKIRSYLETLDSQVQELEWK